MNFPSDKQRLTIVGATGSGKTQAAMWHLSRRDYLSRPWIVYDYKYDSMINQIEGAIHIAVTDEPPTQPGIYIVHPDPGEVDEVASQMWQIWKQENIGVYIDEGYMVGNNNRAFRTLLTQGRSKHIPMIILSQRPVWMDKFVFTESEFFQVFRLQNTRDIKNVGEFIPHDITKRLPEYYSYYYDAPDDSLVILKPVPNENVILDTFSMRLQTLKIKTAI